MRVPALGDRDRIGMTVAGVVGTLEDLGHGAEFAWGMAPACLATRRQLRATGRRPARGARPAAFLSWRAGRRWAGLYPVTDTVPRTPASPRALECLERARTVLRTCRVCGTDTGYRLPDRWDRTCLSCQGDPDDAA